MDRRLVSLEALLRAALGERDAARALLERAGREKGPSLSTTSALAELSLLEGDPVATRTALASHLEPAAGDGAGPAVPAEAWVLDALASHALGEHDEAARSLERALDLIESTGFLRTLLTHGSAIVGPLQLQLRRRTAHRALVAEALATIERREQTAARAPIPLLVEPLSGRELAILRYLPTMKYNREIAAELFVSVNTVKSHLKAIYRKLDVESRRDAVARARELGLMP